MIFKVIIDDCGFKLKAKIVVSKYGFITKKKKIKKIIKWKLTRLKDYISEYFEK